MQKAVEPGNGTEATRDATGTLGDQFDAEPLVQKRSVPREAVERFASGPAAEDHVAEDAEGARVVGLGGMQSDVRIAGQLLGERPEAFHDRGGHARVGVGERRGIDLRRSAYVRDWMALAVQEAKKINDQRSGQRRFAKHARESIVNHSRQSSTTARIGGISLIVATLLFVGVFSYLGARFDYPDVLERPAADVLPALLALGSAGRAVWLLYALIPLLLIPTALAVRHTSRAHAPEFGRIALWLAVLAAAAMTAGLIRWSTFQWGLAESWPTAAPAARDVIAERFAIANLYLGNVVGEFVGELFLNGFFLMAALALARGSSLRWLAVAGAGVSTLGWLAMLRNLTPLVSTLAELNNAVLPVWMLLLGVVLLRRPEDPAGASR